VIKQIDIAGIHYEVTEKMKKYVESKVARLDRYMPRKVRKNVRVEIKLTETLGNKNDKYQAEVVLHMPSGGQMTAVEATLNMYAAVDIVEAKLKNQLRKHKEKHLSHRRVDRKGILQRVRALTERDWWGRQN